MQKARTGSVRKYTGTGLVKKNKNRVKKYYIKILHGQAP